MVQNKKLNDYQKFLVTYRKLCCETYVKVLSLNNENYIFHKTRLTKLWTF